MNAVLESNATKFSQYASPASIVDTEWVAQHLNDPSVRIIESNEDVLLYDTGHIPTAVHIDWQTDLQHQTIRDYISKESFAQICQRNGITPQTKCIFYGDKSNWWACYALWVFHLFGHTNTAIMDGGRNKWIDEKRPFTKDPVSFPQSSYPTPSSTNESSIRSFFNQTLQHAQNHLPLVDVRSPGEFRGEITHMPEYPQEGVLRGGHIPGAKSCPWNRAVNSDGTFKSKNDLLQIYSQELNLKQNDPIIAYCRIGERSSHTWFVLTHLLGYSNVRNYDGSWTEWGNTVRAPIEKSS